MLNTLIVAFLMGLTGSLHCAGMCGAIMWAMPFYGFSGLKRILAFAIYHFMRISAYSLMALVLYSFRSLFQPAIQQVVSIVLGVSLLVAGIVSFLPGRVTPSYSLPWSGYVKKQLSSFIGQPHLGKMAISGFLNGLLPCGLVYMALTASISAGSAAEVIGFLYSFGIGTLPMLASIVFLKGRVRSLGAGTIGKAAPLMVFCFGLLFLIRGLNLGIPYLSPKVEATHGLLKHSCCHKK